MAALTNMRFVPSEVAATIVVPVLRKFFSDIQSSAFVISTAQARRSLELMPRGSPN